MKWTYDKRNEYTLMVGETKMANVFTWRNGTDGYGIVVYHEDGARYYDREGRNFIEAKLLAESLITTK